MEAIGHCPKWIPYPTAACKRRVARLNILYKATGELLGRPSMADNFSMERKRGVLGAMWRLHPVVFILQHMVDGMSGSCMRSLTPASSFI